MKTRFSTHFSKIQPSSKLWRYMREQRVSARWLYRVIVYNGRLPLQLVHVLITMMHHFV